LFEVMRHRERFAVLAVKVIEVRKRFDDQIHKAVRLTSAVGAQLAVTNDAQLYKPIEVGLIDSFSHDCVLAVKCGLKRSAVLGVCPTGEVRGRQGAMAKRGRGIARPVHATQERGRLGRPSFGA
jgi:hypothetical protein